MKNNIYFKHTLDEYNKKYRKRNFKLLKVSKKTVEDFDRQGYSEIKGYLLKNRKWWLIDDTYYEIPKAPSFTWFRNLNIGIQIGVSALLVGAISTSIIVPIVLNNKIDDLTKLKTNYKEYIVENTKLKYFKNKNIEEIMTNISKVSINEYETYIFKDVNYSDQSAAIWSPSEHFYRCLELCVLANSTNDKSLSKKYNEIAFKLLLNWIYSDYKSTNWWQNEINVGKYLTDIGLFLYSSLDIKSKEAFDKKVSISNMYERKELAKQTGANKIDFADITIKQGVIKNNDEIINVGLLAVSSVIDGKDSSYQNDGTFFQHGNLNQTYSYGFECTFKIIKIMSLINKNNKYKIDSKNYKILSKFITSGLKYLTHKGTANYTSTGRIYSRKGGDGLDATLRDVKGLLKLKNIDNFPDINDIENTVNNIINKNSTFNDLVYLKDSKTICLNSDGVYISYKGADSTTIATECRNEENLLGYNLTYGTSTCVMDTGKEYLDIAPYLDYARMPGTTSRSFGDARTTTQDEAIYNYPLSFMDKRLNRKLPSEYKGKDGKTYNSIFNEDIQDDLIIVSEKTKHEDTFMTVTAFATKDGIAILGAGLDYLDKNGNHEKLTTTIEQCIPNSTCELDSTNKIFTNGNAVYTSLCNKTITLDKKEVSGSWFRNNRAASKDIIKSNIATATFSGDDIQDYAYVIQPKSRVNNRFSVVINNENIQAIKLPNGKVATMFFKDDVDSFSLDNKTYKRTVKFDKNKGAFQLFN